MLLISVIKHIPPFLQAVTKEGQIKGPMRVVVRSVDKLFNV